MGSSRKGGPRQTVLVRANVKEVGEAASGPNRLRDSKVQMSQPK